MRLRTAGWLVAALLSMTMAATVGAQTPAAQDQAANAAAQGAATSDAAASSATRAVPGSEPASRSAAASSQASAGQPAEAAAEASATRPATVSAQAQTTPAQVSPEDVRKAFSKRFPELTDDGVTPTPFPGLYEVRLGSDVVYTDAGVNFLLQGTLIDAKQRVDLTAARLEEFSKVAFSSLPLELAVKQVRGDGSRKMAIFEDPNCGYCKQLHKTLKDVDNVTIYSFLFAILTPDSAVKARNIWCAKDKAAVWSAWMVDGKKPGEASCDAPIDQVRDLGRKLMVQGTPAIFFSDGSRINGAVPLDALNKKLDSIKG